MCKFTSIISCIYTHKFEKKSERQGVNFKDKFDTKLTDN